MMDNQIALREEMVCMRLTPDHRHYRNYELLA